MVALGLGLDGLAEQICRLSGQGANCSGNYNKRRQMSFQSKHILTRKSVLVSNSLIVELCLAKVNSRSILGYLHSRSKQGWNANTGSTWRGERGEEWSSAQGLESILISIQSLMSSNPYENEPGFETANDDMDKKNQKDYVAKVCK